MCVTATSGGHNLFGKYGPNLGLNVGLVSYSQCTNFPERKKKKQGLGLIAQQLRRKNKGFGLTKHYSGLGTHNALIS